MEGGCLGGLARSVALLAPQNLMFAEAAAASTEGGRRFLLVVHV
jgi:hypothetical protein